MREVKLSIIIDEKPENKLNIHGKGNEKGTALMKKYYAVKQGKDGISGIFLSWEDCRVQVQGVKGAIYKSFPTLEEAEAFLGRMGAGKEEKKRETDDVIPKEAGRAIAYVDGSFRSDTEEFSCGAVLFWNGEQQEFSRKFKDPELASMHNVAGEILGAGVVIRYCLEHQIPALTIYHDYEGVAKWALGEWKATKPGTQSYASYCNKAKEKLDLSFVKVRGHSGDKWNDRADRLAREALGIE